MISLKSNQKFKSQMQSKFLSNIVLQFINIFFKNNYQNTSLKLHLYLIGHINRLDTTKNSTLNNK